MKKFLVFLLAFFLFTSFALPAALASTSVSTYGDLQAAIAAAPADGTVTTIALDGDLTATTAITIAPGQHIVLVSAMGSYGRIVQTTPSQRHFIVQGSLTLQNITLRGALNTTVVSGGVEVRGGTFDMQPGSQIVGTRAGSAGGGAVLVSDQGAFALNGGVINNNSSSWSGGGVLIDDSSFTMSSGSLIMGNTAAATGGGVEIRNNGTFTMLDGTIQNNAVPSGTANTGGGVEVRVGSSFTMAGGYITTNSAAYGGGVHVSADSSFTMTAGTISYNTAAFNGGGIFSTQNSYANTLPASAFANLTIYAGADFHDNIARNGARRPPTNPQITHIYTTASSIFNHPINNFDINYQPPAGIELITALTITYESDIYGSFDGGLTTVQVQVPLTNRPHLPLSAPRVTRDGLYAFIGWSSDGGTTILSTMQVLSTPLRDDITYVAQYAPPITLSFDANGGNFADSSTLQAIPDIPLDSAYLHAFQTAGIPVQSGYTFRGWFTAPVGGQQVIASRMLLQQTDHTLYAQWTNLPTTTVFFDANGGSFADGATLRHVRGIILDGVYTYANAFLALSPPEMEYFIFAGWFTAPVGGEQVTAGTVVSQVEEHTLYAQWMAVPPVTVTFDARGGTPAIQTTQALPGAAYADAFASISTPTRSAHVFLGWFTDAMGGTRVFPSSIVAQTEAHTLYAHWAKHLPPDFRDDLNVTDIHFSYLIGGGANTINPSANITRAEATTVLMRTFADESRAHFWILENPFPDVPNNGGTWYSNAVSVAHNADLMTGFPNGTFAPAQPITRAEVATILTRKLAEGARFSGTADLFPDIADNWARDAINLAGQLGWFQGDPNGNFNPNANITRAEFAAAINRLLRRTTEHIDTTQMNTWTDNADPNAWFYWDIQIASNSAPNAPIRNWAALQLPDARPEHVFG